MLGGIAVLAFALGVTGIVITHRLVGPAYRLKQLLREVSDGHIHVSGKLRKHDELQDVFEAFQRMVENLRGAREQDIEELDRALDKARAAGASEESWRWFAECAIACGLRSIADRSARVGERTRR